MRRAVLAVLALLAAPPAIGADAPASPPGSPAHPQARRVEIKATAAGFEPREVKVKKGEPVTLVFTRVTDRTCITAVDIPDEKVKRFELPLNKPVELTITPKKA